MKILSLTALVFAGIFSLSAQTSTSDEVNLRNLKQELWPKAYQTQDIALLDKILSNDFQMIDANGNVFQKKDELEYVKRNKPNYDSYKFHVERLQIFEKNTAIISGTGMTQGHDEHGPYIITYRSSDLLVKSGNSWKAVSSQVSGLNKIHVNDMEKVSQTTQSNH
ncbi:MAG: nuclear transport factor 2 family protein [Saprospiraceae bacterium]|nr:nuclear transport factor 2 family protein [Saprospiraceae bacterium]